MEKTAEDQPSVIFGIARYCPPKRGSLRLVYQAALNLVFGHCCVRSSRLFGLTLRMLSHQTRARCSHAYGQCASLARGGNLKVSKVCFFVRLIDCASWHLRPIWPRFSRFIC